MKAKDVAMLIALLVVVCFVIRLSIKLNELERTATRKVNELDQSVTNKLNELDGGVNRLRNDMKAAATQINSMLQPKVSAIVGGFGCGSTLS